MKKLLISLACGAALLCGCNQSNTDSAKIEALSQKLDTVISNQAAIEAKLDAADKMGLYYYTNQANAQLFYAGKAIDELAADEQKSVDGINAETRRVAQVTTAMLLTNDVQIQMAADIEKIKQKLGIY